MDGVLIVVAARGREDPGHRTAGLGVANVPTRRRAVFKGNIMSGPADPGAAVAAPMVGGMLSSAVLTPAVIPAIYALWRERELR